MCESGKNVTIFCDGGSNTTYITHQAADRIRAKKLNRFMLDVTTMGNVEKTYNTRQYQFTLRTDTGKKVSITAFGMDRITGPVSKLDTKVLADLFPGYDVDSLQRRTDKVDILLGCDYFGLFPKSEEAKCGENLSVMKGDFGVCLQGTHPDLKPATLGLWIQELYPTTMVVPLLLSRIPSEPLARMSSGPTLTRSRWRT